MVRLTDLPDNGEFFINYACPVVDIEAFNPGPDLQKRRVALVSTAGLRRLSDQPYSVDSVDYRLLPSEARNELVQDHVSGLHDRTGFSQDLNTVLPIERLQTLAADGVIGSVADTHYSFMGGADVLQMRPAARQIATAMKRDAVDTVLLCPV